MDIWKSVWRRETAGLSNPFRLDFTLLYAQIGYLAQSLAVQHLVIGEIGCTRIIGFGSSWLLF